MSASHNDAVRSVFRCRPCRAWFVFTGALLLGAALLSPVAARGEVVVYDRSGFHTDTPIPTDAKNSGDVHAYGLSQPDKVWPVRGWPITSGPGKPMESLFPWSSGSGNTVTVDGVTLSGGATTPNGYVLGGLWQDPRESNGNVVIVKNGATVNKIYGGAALGTASGNTVYLLGSGTRANQVTGGLSVTSLPGYNSSYNRVLITDATANGIVSGGWNASGDPGDGGPTTPPGTSSEDNDAFWNSVQIGGTATIHANIYGAYNEGNSKTYNNHILITGGKDIKPDLQIAGGYSSVMGKTGTTEVYNNTVTITGGTITLKDGGYNGIYGGRSQSTTGSNIVEVHHNEVVIAGGNITGGTVSGGSAGANSPTQNRVHHNTVNISGGIVAAKVAGGRANDEGIAEYNEVRLSGGTVTGDMYGAYDASTGSNMAAIRNNQVILSGGTAANVYAGYNSGDENNLVTNNAVALLGGGTVTGFVYGTNYGIDATSDTAWQTHGNRLDVLGGLTNAGGVGNFQTTAIHAGAVLNVTGTTSANTTIATADPLVFTKTASAAVFHDLANNGRLTFYNGAANQNIAHITGAYSGGGVLGLDVLVSPEATRDTGDSVIFDRTPGVPVVLEVKGLSGSRAAPYTPITRIAEFRDGGIPVLRTTEHGYGIYAYDIRREGNNYLLGLSDAHTGDIGGSYSDGSSAGLAQVAVVSESFLRDNLENAVLTNDGGGFGIAANMSYSRQRFNTGNPVDLEGRAAFVTLSYHKKGTPFAVGVFADVFQGWYSTNNHVSLPLGDYSIQSKGDLESYGGGVSFQYRARLDEAIASGGFAAWTPGPYLKALARAGYSSMEFETDDAVHPSSFEVGGMYYGASLGGGFVFDPTPGLVVDLYGYGAWTSMTEREVTDSLGQRIDFARADSLRLISGFRAAYKATEHILPYAGLAVEWETLGRPEVHINGYKAETADLSGVSGLIELGVNSRIADGLFLDVKAAGSVGKREGIGGMLEIRYTF